MISEEWRGVPSEPLLEVSSWGRVRSLPYETPMPNGGVKINKVSETYGIISRTSPNYAKKHIVFRRKTYKVSRLVAEAFLGPIPEGLDVSHKNEDSFDNRPSNLVFETRKANLNRPKIKTYHRSVCRAKMESMSEA